MFTHQESKSEVRPKFIVALTTVGHEEKKEVSPGGQEPQ